MTVKQSTKLPRKPYASFPLWAHSNGQWCKKIRGKRYFFGTWENHKAALQAYRDFQDRGNKPKPDGLIVAELCACFLERLNSKVESGDRSNRHLYDCVNTAKRITQYFGREKLVDELTGQDFFGLRNEFQKKQDGGRTSPATRDGHIRRTLAIFHFAEKEGLVQRVEFGADFTGTTAKEKKQLSDRASKKLLDPQSIKKLMRNTNATLKAQILLGINCGLACIDVTQLTAKDIDLKTGWLTQTRTKTFQTRTVKLWPITIKALEALDSPESGPIFKTKYGNEFTPGQVSTNFRKLKAKLGIEAGGSFGALRHTFCSRLELTTPVNIKRWMMGHRRNEIDQRYSHLAPRDQIAEACDSLHGWLFGGEE